VGWNLRAGGVSYFKTHAATPWTSGDDSRAVLISGLSARNLPVKPKVIRWGLGEGNKASWNAGKITRASDFRAFDE